MSASEMIESHMIRYGIEQCRSVGLRALVFGVLTFSFVLPGAPVVGSSAIAASGVVYDSPEGAYEAGRRAFQRGNFRAALEPLRQAADGGVFLAKFYLAEILSDRNHIFANAREAFGLYSELIDLNPDVDPQYDYRAKFVARSYVMKGRYLAGVLPIDGIERSQFQARRLFGHAATYLDYPDAQFEFARMLLKGRGGARNVRSGKHYLSTLSRKGHAAAQGYLAELFWVGELVPKREDYALALSTMAVRNTPREDQIWLGELHHEISCATSSQVHDDADVLLKRWEKTQQRDRIYPRRENDLFSGNKVRWTCQGEDGAGGASGEPIVASDESGPKERWPDQNRLEAMHGSVFGITGDGASDLEDLDKLE